ncbi:MAG TPA: hypothetical protein VGJ26_07755 [Pirellulales bacterium]
MQFPSQVPEGAPYTPPAPGAPTFSAPPAFNPYEAGAANPPPVAPDPFAPVPGQPTGFVGTATRFLQDVSFDSAYLFGNNQGSNLGITELETSASFAIPITRNPFLVTPGFQANIFNGPNSAGFGTADPAMPPETYGAYLDVAWKPQFGQRFSADLGIRPGVWTDFHYVTGRSFRTPARGVGIYTVSPQLQLVAGVVYLDRISVRILPAGGVIWTPTPDARFEVLFPRPKLAHRIATIRNSNLWGFVEGEYGGNTWTVSNNGVGDVVDYNDLRLSMGAEWISPTGRRGHFEAGYVFNRRLMYRDGGATAYPHGTAMLRGGISF